MSAEDKVLSVWEEVESNKLRVLVSFMTCYRYPEEISDLAFSLFDAHVAYLKGAFGTEKTETLIERVTLRREKELVKYLRSRVAGTPVTEKIDLDPDGPTAKE